MKMEKGDLPLSMTGKGEKRMGIQTPDVDDGRDSGGQEFGGWRQFERIETIRIYRV